jgi:hypothetical protein
MRGDDGEERGDDGERPAKIAIGVRRCRNGERDARQSGSEDNVGESEKLIVNPTVEGGSTD